MKILSSSSSISYTLNNNKFISNLTLDYSVFCDLLIKGFDISSFIQRNNVEVLINNIEFKNMISYKDVKIGDILIYSNEECVKKELRGKTDVVDKQVYNFIKGFGNNGCPYYFKNKTNNINDWFEIKPGCEKKFNKRFKPLAKIKNNIITFKEIDNGGVGSLVYINDGDFFTIVEEGARNVPKIISKNMFLRECEKENFNLKLHKKSTILDKIALDIDKEYDELDVHIDCMNKVIDTINHNRLTFRAIPVELVQEYNEALEKVVNRNK